MTIENQYGRSTVVAKSAPEPSGFVRHEPTRIVEVFMAGDIDHAKQVIRRFCTESPCCVTVTPTTYIYKGGEEAGFVVGFRNYPRFPREPVALQLLASDLAERLREELSQRSSMIVDSLGDTEWTTKEGG